MSTLKRPVQIEEFVVTLRDVQDHELYDVKKVTASYIAKLHKTNTKLDKLAKGEAMDNESDLEDEFNEVGPEDKELFAEIITENNVVIRNYEQRIEAVDNELQYRGLPLTTGGPESRSESTSTDDITSKVQEKLKERIDTDNNGVDNNAPNSLFL